MTKITLADLKASKPCVYNFLLAKFATELEADRDKNQPIVKICTEFYDAVFPSLD